MGTWSCKMSQMRTWIFNFLQSFFPGQLDLIHLWRVDIILWYSLLIQSLVCWHFVDFWDRTNIDLKNAQLQCRMRTRNHATWPRQNWLSKSKGQQFLKMIWKLQRFGPLLTTHLVTVMMVLIGGSIFGYYSLAHEYFGQSWGDLGNLEVIWAIFGYYSLAHEVGRVRLQLWVFIRGHSAATQAHYLLEQWAFLEEGEATKYYWGPRIALEMLHKARSLIFFS